MSSELDAARAEVERAKYWALEARRKVSEARNRLAVEVDACGDLELAWSAACDRLRAVEERERVP